MILFLTFIFFIPSDQTFYSDSNTVLWNKQDNGFTCWGYYRARSFYFQKAFQNVPKLILTLEHYESTPNNLGVSLNLVEVTTTYLTVGISCSSPTLYTFGFRWIAMDTESLYVINAFNTVPINFQTYSHSIPQATFAFISLSAFGYTNEINFKIQVKEMNSTHITIETTNIANLRTLGYQIILGEKGIISLLDSISASSAFTSPLYEIKPNSYFITPFYGFWHIPGTENITLNQKLFQTPPNNYYTSDSQGNSYYVNNNHLVLEINRQPKPVECTTLRITQIKDLQADTRLTFQVSLPSLQLIYKDIGQYTINLTTSQLVVIIQIHTKCYQNKKYVSTFNKCNTCQNKRYKNFSHNCYGAINTLIYTGRFTQTMSTNQQLVLYLTSTNCKITQIIQSQEEVILQIQQSNI